MKTCPHCKGTKKIECASCLGSGKEKCRECNGRGWIIDPDAEKRRDCDSCNGEGDMGKCDICRGSCVEEDECGFCDKDGMVEDDYEAEEEQKKDDEKLKMVIWVIWKISINRMMIFD